MELNSIVISGGGWGGGGVQTNKIFCGWEVDMNIWGTHTIVTTNNYYTLIPLYSFVCY